MLLRQYLSHPSEPLTKVVRAWPRLDTEPRKPQKIRALQAQHRLSITEADDLVARYNAGASLADLAQDFQIHTRTVVHHLTHAGLELRPKTVFTPEQIPVLVERYEAGRSLRQLAVEFDVSPGSVRNYLLRVGVVLRPARR